MDISIKKRSSWNKGLTSWNKGLNKDTDIRLANSGKKISATNKGNMIPWNKGKIIGDKCRVKKLWFSKICKQCGNLFFSYPSQKQKFCSESCRSYYVFSPERDPRKGKFNQVEINGIMVSGRSIHTVMRGKAKWKIWRKQLFERDYYTCQMCGDRSKKNHFVYLIPHHIKGVTYFPDEAFNIDNGVTVCLDCHRLIHSNKDIQKSGWYEGKEVL